MEELISIVVPIYNVEKYLKKCIDSIMHQTYQKLEIILVEDGSPDKCSEICEEYAKKDTRIKVIHKENGGLSDARNAGIEIATGQYIAFVDSDDYIASNFIEELYNLCKKNHSDIAECEYIRFSDENFEVQNTEKKEQKILSNQEMIHKIYSQNSDEYVNTVVVWNKLYKRELFDTIRFPKGKIHEDEFTTYKLYWIANNRITVSNKKLYYYRYNPESIMGKKFHKKRLDYIQVLEERLAFFEQKSAIELYDKTLNLYAYILIQYYFFTKEQIPNSKKEQKELWKTFRKHYKEFMKMNVSKRKKIKYMEFNYFPNLFGIVEKSKFKKVVKNMLSKLKQKVKKCIYGNEYKKYSKYCQKNRQREYLIFNAPIHGNIGDHAILYAEYKMLENRKIKAFEIPTYRQHFYFDSIQKNISKDAVICITGGGFIGSQWLEEEELVNKVIHEFYDHKIIIFPQTIFFKDDTQGKEELKKSVAIFDKATNLTICAREEKTFHLAKEIYKKANVILVPDIVLSLEEIQFDCKRENILCVLREDVEGVFSQEDKTKIYNILENYDFHIKHTDTVVNYAIMKENRELELLNKLEQFAKARLVVTDRLHGMIFATITNTPCIVFSNYNYKVEGVYRWIKEVDDNIIFEKDINNIKKDIEKLMNVEIKQNKKKNYHFEKLYEVLEEK